MTDFVSRNVSARVKTEYVLIVFRGKWMEMMILGYFLNSKVDLEGKFPCEMRLVVFVRRGGNRVHLDPNSLDRD